MLTDSRQATGLKIRMENTQGAVMQKMFQALALDERVDGVDLRVFLFLFCRLDFENYRLVEQREIAETLNRQKAHVSRSVRKLKQKGILLEASPKVGRSGRYLLNPRFGK